MLRNFTITYQIHIILFILCFCGLLSQLYRRFIKNQIKKYGVQSKSELKLYKKLLRKNIPVVPQYVIGNYDVDFAWFVNDKRIAIECNGGDRLFSKENMQLYDKKDSYLRQCGWYVLRLTGDEILENSGKVIKRLLSLSRSK